MAASPSHEWNPVDYEQLPLPHVKWGRDLIDSLDLRGDEHVLDVGSGTGRDSALLAERLPDGHVYAVDGDPAMAMASYELLNQLESQQDSPSRRASFTVIQANLEGALPPIGPLDGSISVATLHWIHDHARVFTSIFDRTKQGGWLAVEFGGAGNLEAVEDALAHLGLGSILAGGSFVSVSQTVSELQRAGWGGIEGWNTWTPLVLENPLQKKNYLRNVILGRVLAQLDEDMHDDALDAVLQEISSEPLTYVRVNARAVRLS